MYRTHARLPRPGCAITAVVDRFIRCNCHFNVSERTGPFRIYRTVVDAELGLVHRHELEADHILARSVEGIGVAGHER